MPVREDTYPEPSACEVGWPVFSSPPLSPQCYHKVPICCWVNSERELSQGIESDSSRRPSAREACALTTMLPRLMILRDEFLSQSKQHCTKNVPWGTAAPRLPFLITSQQLETLRKSLEKSQAFFRQPLLHIQPYIYIAFICSLPCYPSISLMPNHFFCVYQEFSQAIFLLELLDFPQNWYKFERSASSSQP